MHLRALLFSCLILPACAFSIDTSKPLLARNPTLSSSSICFEYGTDLWIVDRNGGQAHRLTAGPGVESNPLFSPDGKLVAFTGEYDGNQDVFVVPATGGNPKRLTFHPAQDLVRGWTPDGKSILFASNFEQMQGQNRLYTVPLEGGWPKALPLPRGNTGSFSADSTKIAYVPHDQWQPEWKQHKGGQTTPIWIANLADSKIEKLPRVNSIDRAPMWIGDTIYFVSNRTGRATLFSFDTKSKRVTELFKPEDLDVKSASAGPDGIVFERIGYLYLYDLKSRAVKPVSIEISDDLPEARAAFKSVGNQVQGADISPSGARVVLESRGEVFTVPVEKGDARNLTQTSGVAERSPIWSPDGRKIAYISDASGNYQLNVVDQMDGGKPASYVLSDKPNFYHSLAWSPDSKKVLYIDQSLRLYSLDLESKKYTVVDREPYYFFGDAMNPSWSPDSKWIIYTKHLKNKLQAVFVYNLESGKSSQVTDGLSDASSAVFDRGGRSVYFLASTDIAQTISVGGMSSMGHPVTRSAYVIVLRNTDPSPLSPESDEEKGDAVPAGPPLGPPDRTVKIDFEGISQRILALPLPAANYDSIVALTPGSFLILRGQPLPGPGGSTALKFSFANRQAMPFAQGVQGAISTPRGDKVLLLGLGGIQVVPTMASVQPGQGAVDTSRMQTFVNPHDEWHQMFFEIWRNERDFLYDPNTHGLDIQKAIQRYEPYLDNLASRQDFNYMMQDMLNEVSIGHTFSGGGDVPSGSFVPGGLLGADYSIENGRYRFARIFNGENWNPNLRAPLTQPGNSVKAGEYLLAVNGRDLTAAENVYEAFENTAGKQVRIKVGPTPGGTGSREVTVVPVASEAALRNRTWVEDNRRKVDQLSGGKISYVYMPDTGGGGYASFNRYFTAQLDKDAVLVDERFNGGGALSDYVIQILTRKVLGNANERDNEDFPIPMFVNEGPKAMLINEMAGSGGDAMPWFFRTAKVGPLIGKRTWGGLVAASQGVPLMGGGFHTSPQVAVYGINGEWGVENVGVPPDIEVEDDPYLWRQGREPQLEAGVAYLLDQLKKNPPKVYKRPAYPNYHKGDALGKSGG
jgi:tricorn protease